MNMQPLTTKELDYIVDSMTNEDLLIKQCTAAAASSQNPVVQNVCTHMMQIHQQNCQTLMNLLERHQGLAPAQPQQ